MSKSLYDFMKNAKPLTKYKIPLTEDGYYFRVNDIIFSDKYCAAIISAVNDEGKFIEFVPIDNSTFKYNDLNNILTILDVFDVSFLVKCYNALDLPKKPSYKKVKNVELLDKRRKAGSIISKLKPII